MTSKFVAGDGQGFFQLRIALLFFQGIEKNKEDLQHLACVKCTLIKTRELVCATNTLCPECGEIPPSI